MAHLLALDWDSRELRYLLASPARRSVRVLAVGSLPLAAEDAENAGAGGFSRALAAVLKSHHVQRPRVIVGLPRRRVETFTLTVPPAKDEELPALVANQVVGETAGSGDDCLMDFVPLDADSAAPRRVLAVSLSREQRESIERELAAVPLRPSRIVLRSFAAASLYRRLARGGSVPCVLVSLVGDDADLNVLGGDLILGTRTARVPEGEAGERADLLITEIGRTLTVAPLEHPALGPIERVGLLGSEGEFAELARRLADERRVQTMVVDPFPLLGVPADLVPPDSARFAPLLGMVLDEAEDAHSLDLLHPRKARRPIGRWRLGLGLAAAAAAVIGLLSWQVYSQLGEIRSETQILAQRYADMDEVMKKVGEQQKVLTAVSGWAVRDINWLEELRDLSIRFPGKRDAVVLRMTLRGSASGGQIDLSGLVRDPMIVANLEHLLRDEYRQVDSNRVQQRASEEAYSSLFQTKIQTSWRPKESYVSHFPAGELGQPKSRVRVAASDASLREEGKP